MAEGESSLDLSSGSGHFGLIAPATVLGISKSIHQLLGLKEHQPPIESFKTMRHARLAESLEPILALPSLQTVVSANCCQLPTSTASWQVSLDNSHTSDLLKRAVFPAASVPMMVALADSSPPTWLAAPSIMIALAPRLCAIAREPIRPLTRDECELATTAVLLCSTHLRVAVVEIKFQSASHAQNT